MTIQLINGSLYKLKTNIPTYDWVYNTTDLLFYNLFKISKKFSNEKMVNIVLYLGKETLVSYDYARFLYSDKIIKFKIEYYEGIFLRHWEIV